jgi:DNA polymerase I
LEGLRPRLYRGRIHAGFTLHGTVTGRLSCREPNLQNIPRAGSDEDDIGQKIRRLFIAPPGHKLVVLDYGQVELRVLAMESQDPALMGIFKRGEDVHSGTIAQIRRKRVEDVSKEERQLGKTLAFAITYGAGPDKVAATAKVKVKIAEETIDGYYDTFKGVSKWKNQALREGRKYGYVTTMSGRKRRLPMLNSSEWGLKGRAERQAINAIIQGSAADICKDAMIAVHEAFEGTPFQLVLQVHDELMAIVPEDMVDEALRIMRKAMGDGTIRRGVPINASGDAASNWAEAK